MDSIFRPKPSPSGLLPAGNDDILYRTLPKQLKKQSPGFLGAQAASRPSAPVGSPSNQQWVDRVNSMDNSQLDSFFEQQTLPYYKNVFRPDKDFRSSTPIATQPGSNVMNLGPRKENPLQTQYRNMQSQKSAGAKTMEYNPATIPPAAPRTMELRPNDLARGQMLRLGGSTAGAGVTQAVPGLANTATRGAGFIMDGDLNQIPPSQASPPGVPGSATGGAYVRPPYAPRLFASSPVPRAGIPQSTPFRQGTSEDALAEFNAEARRLAAQPRESLYGMTSGIITDALAREKQRTAEDVRGLVDDRLAARQGFYATPQQRQSGFFARGMGPMAGDAAIMARQNRPLGDGGPAAAAARADQNRRRMEAEQAMGGLAPDGLARYMPNQDLMDFANADRVREDERRSTAMEQAGLGSGGTSYRQPMQAMTPSEIQFYRHKMNMATNPVYANRVNQNRADRQEMLDNRREMVRARRAGALEAAGASQQMRNLMAGRGAIGPGPDGAAALMSLGAMQSPMGAMSQAPDMMRAQNEPMLRMLGYGNQMALNQQQQGFMRDMMDKKSEMDRNSQYREFAMGIANNPELTPSDRARMLTAGREIFGIQGGGQASAATGTFGPFDTIPKPNIDPSTMTPVEANLALQRHLDMYGKHLTPEQRNQYISEYGAQLDPAQRERARLDNSSLLNPYSDPALQSLEPFIGSAGTQLIVNPLLSLLGLDYPSRLERTERNRHLQNNP